MEEIEPNGKTPLYLAMSRFKDPAHAPVFSNGEGRPFLVIVSDGDDTCGTEVPDAGERVIGASAAELGVLTRELWDDYGISTIAVGFGTGINAAQLRAIASALR